MSLSFSVSDTDRELIAAIVERTLDIIAEHETLRPRDRANRRVNLRMDVTACHASGNPLRLNDLLAANDFNVMHDVGGISRYIDHETGELTQCFLPRFSAKKDDASLRAIGERNRASAEAAYPA